MESNSNCTNVGLKLVESADDESIAHILIAPMWD